MVRAGVAQLVELLLPKQKVAGSNPVSRFLTYNCQHVRRRRTTTDNLSIINKVGSC